MTDNPNVWRDWIIRLSSPKPAKKPREPMAQLGHYLNFHDIDLVIDVGANEGQYARLIRRYGYQGMIWSFEPVQSVWEKLHHAALSDPLWQVAPAMALGSSSGHADIHVSQESDMSSLLSQNRLLTSISPTSKPLGCEKVPLERLDSLSWPEANAIHLKLDVQGYEPQVLEGLGSRWEQIASIQLELSLMALYEGEKNWQEMTAFLAEKGGFELYLILPGYYERKLGRHLQFDAVFSRSTAG